MEDNQDYEKFDETSKDSIDYIEENQISNDEEVYEILDNDYADELVNQKSSDKKKKELSENAKMYSDATKTAAEGVATAYGGALGASAVKAFSKSNLGKKTFDKAGTTLDRMDNLAKHPLGIVNPYQNKDENENENESENNKPELDNNELNNSNELTKSDELKNTQDDEKDKGNLLDKLKDRKKSDSDQNLLDNFGKGFGKKLRLYLIIALGFFFLLFLIFFVIAYGKDNAILDLTGTIYKPTDKGTSSGVNAGYSTAYIEKSMLYVGDERTLDMQQYIKSTSVQFIGEEKADYNWLISKGKSLINSKVNEENSEVKYVIINLGLYDLDNADKYINIFNSLKGSNDKITYIFMSVNPVLDNKVPSSMNSTRINNFNNRLRAKLGDNFVDTNTSIKTSFTSSDGIKYDGATYRTIHSTVLEHIKTYFRHGFLAEYPHGTEGTQLLQDNIIKVIGQTAYDSINSAVKSGVQKSGICNKESSAIAGINLAYNLYELGYRVPYYWNGGHDMHDIGGTSAYVDYKGVDKGLGSSVAQSCSDTTCYSHYGYDCTGFVNWAVSNAMGKDISTSLDGWFSRSAYISLEEAEAGDLILTDGHAILVIENKGNYLQTLESTGGDNGLIFRTYDNGELSSLGATVRSLTPYFEQECG